MVVFLVLACTSKPPAPPSSDVPGVPPVPAPPADLEGAGLFRPWRALDEHQRAEVEALESLGYTQGEAAAPTTAGVVRYEPSAVAPGVNLWCSGHAPEAYLMAADGTVLHRWRRSWAEVFGDERIRGRARGTRYWRRVHAFGNGDLLAVFEGHGLVKLDRESTVLWRLRERVHHDLEVLADGRILVLSRKGAVLPRYDAERPVLDDRILVLSPEGVIQREISLLAALERSPWIGWLTETGRTHGDLFHTNSLQVLPKPFPGIPESAAGQVLISIRAFHTVALVDLPSETVVWAARGPWRGQHDAQQLDNGNLLLFDNFGAKGGHGSAIRELRASDLDAVWTYEGTEAAPFSSPFFGAAQRLPNGNTLVSDSWVGRALEVTPQGTIVWAYRNPHRVKGDGGEDFIAVLPHLSRLPGPLEQQTRP